MKERPILMNAPMVRAVLDGSKTQTRRIAKLLLPGDKNYIFSGSIEEWASKRAAQGPYGKPGDRLWVRETHLPKASGTIYRADFSEFEAAGLGGLYGGWKPSIFCKREHSRILLEIVSVRVERVQSISEDNALAEGVTLHPVKSSRAERMARDAYRKLWESINGSSSWDENPWVWVIEFRRVQP